MKSNTLQAGKQKHQNGLERLNNMKIKKNTYQYTVKRNRYNVKCQLCDKFSDEFYENSKITDLTWDEDDDYFDESSSICGVTKEHFNKYPEGISEYKSFFYVFCPSCFENKVMDKINELGVKPNIIDGESKSVIYAEERKEF